MRRTFLAKISMLAACAVTALVLTVYRPSPEGLMPFGVGQAEVRAAPGTPASKHGNYNLSALSIISSTLQKIDDNYVDRSRIDPKEMLLSALDYVQRNVAEVMIEASADKKQVTVQVNDKQQVFTVADVDSPWRLHARMKEIFRFIQANMNPSSDPRDIEYAAANGILSTLDPHSVLLDPEQAAEMDIQTSGKFGGIGIVIGMRKNKLSVIRLISADTPAAKAGLKAGDHILKINAEPTENLTLNEAMNRLRGDPATRVSVTIQRKGETTSRDVPITRASIAVSSVAEARLLQGNVGYLKVENFAQETARDLKKSMEQLRRQGARGWVLDLRNNPGGLLQQAIEVTDLFVEQGTIVTTVGNAGKTREEKRAHAGGADTQAPLAVLVNGGSASASEIVAGAIKNLNRGVIIGQTSFGKGSVQVIFDNTDSSKLKLTIAQYLTPGDVSIQSVGITPDIELVRVKVPTQMKDHKDVLDLRGKSRYMRESDLDSHLTSKNARKGEKPVEVVKYLYIAPKGAQPADDDEEDGDGAAAQEGDDAEEPVDGFVEDFEIQFARDFVVSSGASARRSDSLTGSRAYVQKRRSEEDVKIAQALTKIGIDWSTGKASGAKLQASFTTDRVGNKVVAGDVIAMTGTVSNIGSAPAYRVHAWTKSDDWTFEDREFAFGRIDPGQSRSFTTFVKVSKGAVTRMDEVTFELSEHNNAKGEAPPAKVAIEGQARPLFAYTYQLVDEKGNGDGLLQRGESFRLHVTVKNLGPGKATKTQAQISNKTPNTNAVVVNKGRFEVGELASNETKTVDFTFDVNKEKLDEKEVTVELVVYDRELGESVSDKLKFPVRQQGAGPQAASGQVKVTKKDSAQVREGAAEDSAVIGTAKKGAVFKVTGREGPWTRVEIGAGRHGFVLSSALSGAGGSPTANAFVPLWQVTPPTIAVQATSFETTSDRFKLSGQAQDDNHVEDVYIVVSNRESKIESRKVFYRSNRAGKNHAKMDFAGDIPVWPGSNMVTVVVRENDEVRSTHTMYVYRQSKKGPATAQTSESGK
jgi:carboxyl-terminal processing protease